MNQLYIYKKSESLKKTNKILNKSNSQKLLETLASTVLLILAYDALLFGSDFLIQYCQNGEINDIILINKPFFHIVIPGFIGGINTAIRKRININKEFNAGINLHVMKWQIKNNTDIYNLDEEAIKSAKSVDIKIVEKNKNNKNISIYAVDPNNTIYVDGIPIKSDDINKIASEKDENKFVYFQEEKKVLPNVKYYEIEPLDKELKELLLEQTNSQNINQIFSKKKVLVKK